EYEVNLWHQKHDSSVERVTDVKDEVGTSSQQTYVSDKESNIESGVIDYEYSQANKGPSFRIQENHPEENIIRYRDADLGGSADDRINPSGGCFLLDNNLISWFNQK
ncbi:gag-pol polyprotein, partial [Trifolium medium]|nr:gag-pol polyprotein [Trifolium medium]